MTVDPSFDRIRAIVVRVAGPDRRPATIGPETLLGEGGFWLDSVELLEVLLACEEEMGVTLEGDRGVGPQDLTSLGTLASVVRAGPRE